MEENKNENNEAFNYSNDEILSYGSNERFVEEDPKMPFGERLISLVVAPTKLFKNIQVHKNILPILLFLMLLIAITSIISIMNTDILTEASYQMTSAKYGSDFANKMRTFNEQQASLVTGPVKIISTVIGVAFGVLVVVIAFLGDALAKMIVGKALKITIDYKTALATILYIAIIPMVFSIVQGIITMLLGSSLNIFSLAVLVPDLTNPNYSLLSSIVIYNIWVYFLQYTAFKNFGESNSKKALIAMIVFIILDIIFIFVSLQIANIGTQSLYNTLSNM